LPGDTLIIGQMVKVPLTVVSDVRFWQCIALLNDISCHLLRFTAASVSQKSDAALAMIGINLSFTSCMKTKSTRRAKAGWGRIWMTYKI